MTTNQWETLLKVIVGEQVEPLPVGFIIDSPWLPNWAGMTIKEYFDNDQKWLDANLKAVRKFPDLIFLPGFWSEFGMCTEPAAFGAKCIWYEDDFPFAEKVITEAERIQDLEVPDPRTAGLCPAMLARLKKNQGAIEDEGHAIKFAVARGPLNVASFLMGTTEFLMAMSMQPELCTELLRKVTDFTVDWIKVQKEAFPSIEGVLLLDDICGFIGPDDFQTHAAPNMKRIYEAFDAKVKFFHNDAEGKHCAPYLADIGINLFNFSFEHSLPEMKEWTDNKVALLGNIPPRDVLAQGAPAEVRSVAKEALASLEDKTRLILSCGGGMPPGVSADNIRAFLDAVRS
ncbi:MAG: uroporphyrinogen decarboxylase family protein [Opitutales bacterium]